MPNAARSAPVLRVLRLARAILAGTRAGRRLRRRELAALRPMPTGAPVVTALDPDSKAATTLIWPQLLAWVSDPKKGWLHAANLDAAHLDGLAHATGLPRARLDAALGEASYPRLDKLERWTALTLPLFRADGSREALMVLLSEEGVLSLARHEELVGGFERALRALEEIPADESPHEFFVDTFRMRKRISTSRADLWRLNGVLKAVAEGRRTLPGVSQESHEEVERTAEEAGFLHETADGLRESLLSLLDLHLNISGYGMNRFMRLLAIVSALALIPTIIGGLLGMNLTTNPWPATLAQVAFGTFVLMMCMLYVFLAKGWLKS